MEHDAGKDIVGGELLVAGNGHDLERQARHEQELPAAADHHGTQGLVIGHLIREVMLEGLATFVVVFWTCMAALMQEMHQALSFPMVCVVVGATVAFVLSWVGPAHFNPAVTVAFAAFRRIPFFKLPLYVAAQLGGSALACVSVNGIMEPRPEHFYGTVPMAGHTKLPFLMELLASAVLIIVIAAVARGSASQAVGGLAIGAAVGVLGLIIGPVSGGSMNPARSLGPAMVMHRYTSIWIYVVAPVSGMLVGALCNRLVMQSDAIIAFLSSSLPCNSTAT